MRDRRAGSQDDTADPVGEGVHGFAVARFAGMTTLELCVAEGYRLPFDNSDTPAVTRVKKAPSYLGYPSLGDDDGIFGKRTGRAVTSFKVDSRRRPVWLSRRTQRPRDPTDDRAIPSDASSCAGRRRGAESYPGVIERLYSLNALVAGEVPGADLALDPLTAIIENADAASLEAAVIAYQSELVSQLGGPANSVAFFDDLVTRSLPDLGPLLAAVEAAAPLDRQSARDVLVSRQVGPAEVLLSAPAVIAALPDGTSRHMVAHLPVDSLVIGLDAGAITARGAGFLQSNPAAAGAYLAAGVGPVQAVLALLLGEMDGQMSVLGLIRAEFRPTGFQLGFGFSLDAVGGLIGVNRRADVDELRRRLSDGTAADSLFGGTTSSTAGILATLRALDRMFPVALGSVVVGPTLRLGWLTVGTYSLARADVGVILELPRGRVVVPGRVIIEVPGPSLPLVHLRLDMLGEVDPAARLLAADAALVDSTVVGAFSVNGTAALRLSWGDAPYAVVTVGGFYPGFDPSPAVIPLQRRISLVLSNPIPAGLSIHAEGYFAVGAGTLQMGGSLNVSFEIAESGISGSVGVDALVQLSPLWFTATVTGSVQLHAFGIELMGVQVRGDLTGPGPLVLTAEARGEILGADVGGRNSFVLSSSPGQTREPAPSLADAVARQLNTSANVRGEQGIDPDVVVVEHPLPTDVALVAPGLPVIWSQEAFPLGQAVEKADGRLLAQPAVVTVITGGTSTLVDRLLPTASFMDLTDSEVLSVQQFEERPAGLRIQPIRQQSPDEETAPTDHLTIWLPPEIGRAAKKSTWVRSRLLVAAAQLTRMGATLTEGVAPSATVTPDSWNVVMAGVVTADGVPGGAAAHALRRHHAGATAMPKAAFEAAIA